MGLKLLRKNRLRKRSVFRKVYEDGRFVANPMMSFHFFLNIDNSRRIGFAAGKKLGSAVVRNRCKRRLRECYRLYQDKVPAGVDCIVVARRAMVNANWETIVRAFLDIVRRSQGIIENNRSKR